jgi:sodium-dependent dicarboxylate transporter 2/3/5
MTSQALPVKSKSIIRNKTVFHFTIAAIIGVFLYLLLQPQEGQLTESGVRTLSVVIPTIYLWVTLNTHWTCLLFPAMMVVAGIMAPVAVWQASLGNFVVMNALAFTILCTVLAEKGVMDKVAVWFMTRRFCKGRPYAFLAMFYLSEMVLGIFMTNVAITILFVNLTVKICEQIGVKKGHTLNNILHIGIMWVNGIQSAASPITMGILMIGILASVGVVVTMAQWFLAGVALTILGLIFVMIAVRIYNPDVEPLKKLDLDEIARSVPPLSKSAKMTAIVVASAFALVVLPDFFVMFGILPGFFKWISGLTTPTIAILGVIALCVLPSKNEKGESEQLLDFPKIAPKVPVTILLFIACIQLMTVPIAADWTGIVSWMSANISPLVEGLAPVTVMIILVVFTIIQTNFLSTVVTMNLYFFVGVALLGGAGINIGAWGILIAFAANVAFLTPGASLTTPFFYGPGHVEMATAARINLVFMGLSFIKLLILMPFLFWLIST